MGAVPWLFWHRRDLRLADNLGLARLAAHTTAITGLVVLETDLWAGPGAAAARLWFLLASVAELQQAWRRAAFRPGSWVTDGRGIRTPAQAMVGVPGVRPRAGQGGAPPSRSCKGKNHPEQ